MVYLPDDKVLITVRHTCQWSRPTFQDGFVKHWIQTLDEIQTLGVEHFVPGHGELMTARDVGALRSSMFTFYAGVKHRFQIEARVRAKSASRWISQAGMRWNARMSSAETSTAHTWRSSETALTNDNAYSDIPAAQDTRTQRENIRCTGQNYRCSLSVKREAYAGDASMIYEQIATGGCQSYLLGCSETCAAVVIDPEASQVDRYLGLAARDGLRIRYLIDTHTHADHFSGTRQLARQLGVPVVMHRESPAPFVDMRLDDGDMIHVGRLRLQVMHTPGHTRDSMCLQVEDHLFTGDTLLFGGTGRTDLPTGDPEALYDSLFSGILRLDAALKVHPAHDYKGGVQSTLARELAENPRLQKRDRAAFVEMMRSLNLSMPTHITEALRSNMSGGKTVAQLLAQAAAMVPFMSLPELKARVEAADQNFIVLDVRERDAYENGHIPRARLLPRGQLELRVNDDLPDPTKRIVACCEFGRISTLAAATLRELGYQRAVALDGGVKAWREAGYPLHSGSEA